MRFSPERVKAPELTGRAWINVGQPPLSLTQLRGKIVLLDFWTFCCINCLHALEELRELEREFADVLVVIGIHSPKFLHEADHEAVVAACERYDVCHAVLDDPFMLTWQRYNIHAWPTLVVIDPDGHIVAEMAGSGHGRTLRQLFQMLIANHEAKGNLNRGQGPYVPQPAEPTHLRFPSKALLLRSGRMLIADTKHHQLVEVSNEVGKVFRRIGNGTRGLLDGGPEAAAFNEPQGLCELPEDIAALVGYNIVVADTANHTLRGVQLETGNVTTIAGTGMQRRWWSSSELCGPAREIELSSPWDVAWYREGIVVAMAGVHQLWSFGPQACIVKVFAGTGHEGLVDGPVEKASFAQPSGLAVSPDGATLWLVDAETSALRSITGDVVTTAVGTGLFDFGHRDGTAVDALLQHPLGLAILPDGTIAVADTFNGAIRTYDPATATVGTLATGLKDPSDTIHTADGLLVVESGAHRVVHLRLSNLILQSRNPDNSVQNLPATIKPGDFNLAVISASSPLGEGDGQCEPTTRLAISASPPSLLVSGGGIGAEFTRALRIADEPRSGILRISAVTSSYDDASTENDNFPVCRVQQQDWRIPVTVTHAGQSELTLVFNRQDSCPP